MTGSATAVGNDVIVGVDVVVVVVVVVDVDVDGDGNGNVVTTVDVSAGATTTAGAGVCVFLSLFPSLDPSSDPPDPTTSIVTATLNTPAKNAPTTIAGEATTLRPGTRTTFVISSCPLASRSLSNRFFGLPMGAPNQSTSMRVPISGSMGRECASSMSRVTAVDSVFATDPGYRVASFRVQPHAALVASSRRGSDVGQSHTKRDLHTFDRDRSRS
jgi:hypothetical protein